MGDKENLGLEILDIKVVDIFLLDFLYGFLLGVDEKIGIRKGDLKRYCWRIV